MVQMANLELADNTLAKSKKVLSNDEYESQSTGRFQIKVGKWKLFYKQ